MIFGIGLGRTGTTSLSKALTILGYKGLHHPKPKELQKFFTGVYDFGIDLPFSTRFKEFDKLFPNSKFILTIRTNINNWLLSILEKHKQLPLDKIPKHYLEYRIEKYKRIDFEVNNQLTILLEHYMDVLSYFRNRIGDLLILDIIEGDSWEPLCLFLGNEIPKEEFPKIK